MEDLIDKPPSIGRFERLWWLSAFLSLVAAFLSWDRVQNTMRLRFAGDPALRANPFGPIIVEWTQPTALAITIAWTTVVWLLIAKRASRIGRWLVVSTAVVSGALLGILLIGLAFGRTLHPMSHGATVAASILTVLASVALFEPASRAWFGDAASIGQDER